MRSPCVPQASLGRSCRRLTVIPTERRETGAKLGVIDQCAVREPSMHGNLGEPIRLGNVRVPHHHQPCLPSRMGTSMPRVL
jgi:hypothetical protein